MTIPHLDEEALSAALDDEGSDTEIEHLAACPHCQAGVARLAAVTRAVAAPVPPRPAIDVTAAVDRALASRDEPAPGIAPDRPAVVPMTAAVGGGRGSPGRGGGRSSRWATAAAGIAAAVLVAAVVVGISRSAGRQARSTTSAAVPASGPAIASGNSGHSPLAAATADLGDQSDPAGLARAVNGVLNPSAAQAVPVSPKDQARATASTAAAPALSSPASPCADLARVAAGTSSGPRLVASLRWQGQPAVVLVFPTATGSVAVVMRTADCARLALVPL